ncbi:MAG: hypothetical protein ACRD0A_18940 [Acidimicrobiales bacterium]
MEIADSARRHGVADDDIRHAVRMAIRTVAQDAERVLIIGADRDGRLLEVVVIDLHTDEPIVIHAMPLRPTFYRYL